MPFKNLLCWVHFILSIYCFISLKRAKTEAEISTSLPDPLFLPGRSCRLVWRKQPSAGKEVSSWGELWGGFKGQPWQTSVGSQDDPYTVTEHTALWECVVIKALENLHVSSFSQAFPYEPRWPSLCSCCCLEDSNNCYFPRDNPQASPS